MLRRSLPEPASVRGRDSYAGASFPLKDERVELEESRFIITEQLREIERLQSELACARRLSLRLLERQHARYATVSPTGEILDCSRAFAELFELSPLELQGRSFLEFLRGAERGSFLSHCRVCLGGHQEVSVELRLSDLKNSQLVLRVSMSRLADSIATEQPDTVELLVLVTDASRHGCGGSELTQPEVTSPAATVVDANAQPSATSPGTPPRLNTETVGWFAGGVAHDFNNLLTVITCNISMAMMDLSGENAIVPLLKDAAQAVNKATELTGQLLEYSRQQPVVSEPARIELLVEELLPALREVVGSRVALRMVHDAEGGIVNIDPRQFEQVVTSLVMSARDAMSGEGLVTIETASVVIEEQRMTCRPALGAGSYVALRVIDQGKGMSVDAIERLFEPFYGANSMTKDTGIGLATAYTAVRQAGGGIEVTSNEGAGTCITVYWPRASKVIRNPPSGCYRVRVDGGPATILLVEDEPSLRALGMRILKRLGYRVLEAANGVEALELAANHPGRIDLLFTDIVMPAMNGRQLAEALRIRRPELKILFTSGYTEHIFDTSIEEASPNHAAADKPPNYLSKPYKPEALANRIKEILRSRHE